MPFSEKEFQFLTDTDFLLARAEITRKLANLLNATVRVLKPLAQQHSTSFPQGTDVRNGRLSRGENYRGLPWLVLDFPRKFSQEEVFALRTMVWWGHECSCTLHVQGETARRLLPALVGNLPAAAAGNCFFCLNPSPWEYHFGPANYLPASQVSAAMLQQQVNRHQFFKISRKLPLLHADKLPVFSKETFEMYFYQLLASPDEHSM